MEEKRGDMAKVLSIGRKREQEISSALKSAWIMGGRVSDFILKVTKGMDCESVYMGYIIGRLIEKNDSNRGDTEGMESLVMALKRMAEKGGETHEKG